MQGRLGSLGVTAATLAVVVACAEEARSPPGTNIPTPPVVQPAGAPILSAPADGTVQSPYSALVLAVGDPAGAYTEVPTGYDLEVRDPNDNVVATASVPRAGNKTSYAVTSQLPGSTPLTWRARAAFSSGSRSEWSATASFSLRAAANVNEPPGGDSIGTPIDMSKGPIQLQAHVQMQGRDFDCTERAEWRNETPAVASLSPRGVLTPVKTGEVRVTTRCEGDDGSRTFQIVDEIWTGEIAVDACTRTFGSGACWIPAVDAGSRLPFTIVIARDFPWSRIRLPNLPDVLIDGRVAGDGAVGLDGTARRNGSCTYDSPTQIFRVHTIGTTAAIDIEEWAPGCGSKPVVGRWTVTGRLINVGR